MTFTHTCQSCNRHISLSYDEADSTPEFCPFCGEDIEDDGEASYDDPGARGIAGADFDMGDEWDGYR